MKDSFYPSSDTSYSAGLVFLVTKPEPQIALVLQKGGEANPQKTGSDFIEKRSWKIPMGHFDPTKDQNLLDTAIREFEEETGVLVDLKEVAVEGGSTIKIRSQRPGHKFHEDRYYLISSKNFPEKDVEPDPLIEKVEFFPVKSLPIRPVNKATLALGNRIKLKNLLLSCQPFFQSIEVNVEKVIDSLEIE